MEILNQQRIRRAAATAAAGYDDADFLHREIRDRLLARLDLTRIEPHWILDLGAGTGGAVTGLKRIYPDATVVTLDIVPEMLSAGAATMSPGERLPLCADAARIACVDASFDLIVSNLMLPWCPDPLVVLTEARRVIRFPGLFLFTTLGPATMQELRAAWKAADSFTHVFPFMDMHDLGDLLIRAGFAEPVVDTERLTITYEDVVKLVADLRGIGSVNATPARNPGLTGRRTWARMRSAYDQLRDSSGRLPVTLEVVYGQAWRDDPRHGRRATAGEAEIPVDSLVGRLR